MYCTTAKYVLYLIHYVLYFNTVYSTKAGLVSIFRCKYNVKLNAQIFIVLNHTTKNILMQVNLPLALGKFTSAQLIYFRAHLTAEHDI